ncbi:MAG: FKBP-type peptidyl-prolyl cis-trans isomerase [Pseudomonadota bacterium]|jgi:FKBP-type peptidyl-prolyl cis-trans isomerase
MYRFLALVSVALLCAPTLACAQKEAPKAKYDLSAASNQKFMADYAAKPGVFKTQDGLQYRVLKAGKGKSPQSGADMVTVTYKGWLINGKVFDQTQKGQTADFPAGQLIPGWVEALSLMKEGDSWELVVPSELGYGADGAGNDIPPNQTLVFDMTLLKVTPAR